MNIIGKPTKISKEEFRALAHACQTILEYHKLKTPRLCAIQIVAQTVLDADHKDKSAAGDYDHLEGLIRVTEGYDWSAMATILLHEMIHAYIFNTTGYEKVTSTLTARLKPDVIALANILVANTYKRAAYIAHTKISYRPKKKDFYDDDQYHRDHGSSEGKKYRGKRLLTMKNNSPKGLTN